VHLGHVADPRLHVFAEPGARIWKRIADSLWMRVKMDKPPNQRDNGQFSPFRKNIPKLLHQKGS
jgi:hypothetical protein